MPNEHDPTKRVLTGDSAPTSRLRQEILKKSVPTQALATALAKAPAMPASQATTSPKK